MGGRGGRVYSESYARRARFIASLRKSLLEVLRYRQRRDTTYGSYSSMYHAIETWHSLFHFTRKILLAGGHWVTGNIISKWRPLSAATWPRPRRAPPRHGPLDYTRHVPYEFTKSHNHSRCQQAPAETAGTPVGAPRQSRPALSIELVEPVCLRARRPLASHRNAATHQEPHANDTSTHTRAVGQRHAHKGAGSRAHAAHRDKARAQAPADADAQAGTYQSGGTCCLDVVVMCEQVVLGFLLRQHRACHTRPKNQVARDKGGSIRQEQARTGGTSSAAQLRDGVERLRQRRALRARQALPRPHRDEEVLAPCRNTPVVITGYCARSSVGVGASGIAPGLAIRRHRHPLPRHSAHGRGHCYLSDH